MERCFLLFLSIGFLLCVSWAPGSIYAHMNGIEYVIKNMPPEKSSKKERKKESKKVEKVEKKPEPKEETADKASEQEPVASSSTAAASNDPDDIHEQIRKLKEEVRAQYGREPPKPAAPAAPAAAEKAKEAPKEASTEEKATEAGSPGVGSGETAGTQMGGDGGRAATESGNPQKRVDEEVTEGESRRSIPIIVIDPGHGGKDPGASGLRGKVREKDVILAIAKQLAVSLKQKLGAKVYFTRANDTFITLGERDRIANRRHADFFISIHANASTNTKAQGIEIYYLNKATDQASRRLASRENAGAPKQEKEIEAIVSDLLQTAATEESSELAKSVKGSFEKRLVKKHKVQDVGIKTALFYVLVGAKCPSLLIETGFVTNPVEGRRLTKPLFQKDMANAIADAVALYWKKSTEAGGDL